MGNGRKTLKETSAHATEEGSDKEQDRKGPIGYVVAQVQKKQNGWGRSNDVMVDDCSGKKRR